MKTNNATPDMTAWETNDGEMPDNCMTGPELMAKYGHLPHIQSNEKSLPNWQLGILSVIPLVIIGIIFALTQLL